MNLGELKELWRKTGFRPTKRMGQNFLHDANARKKLLSCLELDDNSVVVEIGPGFGAMTFDIRGKCRKLFVVEKDRKICDIMAPFFFEYPGIELIESDILDVEFARFCERGEKITVYGNIPYNISTPLIEKIISQRDYVKNVYFVMQEEVVDRIVAGPGTKDYGALSCYVQYFTRARKLGRIKKKSFYPGNSGKTFRGCYR
jgi:16S rRNA (adenine1518-N6/adenine1519-N6)-dimethyltransferase